MGRITDVLLYWLSRYALPTLFVVMAMKNCAFLGFAVPGTTTLAVAGFLAGAGRLSISSVLIVSVAGVLVGNNISYIVGRRIRGSIEDYGRLRSEMPRVRHWADRHVGVLFFFQFPVPVRVLLPLTLGSVHFPWRRWLAVDIAASVLFVCTIGFASYGIGRGARNATEAVRFSEIVQWVIAGVLAVWLAVLIGRFLYARRLSRR